MARDIDPENMSSDDVEYVKQRPWLVREFEMQGYTLEVNGEGSNDDEDEGYSDWSVKELKAEIDSRNEDRDEDDQIVPEEPGNKAELVAALEADDEASDEG